MNATQATAPEFMPALKLGISACLLGQEVRFDGGHKRNAFLTDLLGRFVEWVPVCPEVEVGMGTPRETVNLVLIGEQPHMVGTRSGEDWTAAMKWWAQERLERLEEMELRGYVLKKDSPSCGMERVKLYAGTGTVPVREGRGLFAAALMARWPLLPVEEEGRLQDAWLRENFIERVFAYDRLLRFFNSDWTLAGLSEFQAAHKLQLMAHSAREASALGRLAAEAKTMAPDELQQRYQTQFMQTLARRATPRRHVNVMQHMMGFFKKSLPAVVRQRLAETVEEYRLGLVPLVVPVTLLRHYVELEGVQYLRGQTYLEPHPRELMLRNHV